MQLSKKQYFPCDDDDDDYLKDNDKDSHKYKDKDIENDADGRDVAPPPDVCSGNTPPPLAQGP